MKSVDEIIEAHPDAYADGIRFAIRFMSALADLERGNPEKAEEESCCNGFTIGCPS